MNIAIIENNIVTNVIICDSFELARELTGVSEVLDANLEKIGMRFFRENGVWYPPSPYPSWILDKSKKEWEPPIPYPVDDKTYVWNEVTQVWDEVI